MNLIKVYLSHIYGSNLWNLFDIDNIYIAWNNKVIRIVSNVLYSRTEPTDIFLSLTLAYHIHRFLNLKFRIKISFEILELFKKMTIGQLLE